MDVEAERDLIDLLARMSGALNDIRDALMEIARNSEALRTLAPKS